ncbi:MAG: Omp28-related outer membrane protein [Bacteroidota bacterium]|nr:Omp28-related outer membrane protein [Bacteroidota bacterium]
MKYTKLTLAIAVLFAMASCGKKGCTDPMSLAYNSEATKDNGSCTYPANEKRALVFNATATWCAYCGGWGADYVNNIGDDFPGSAEVITLHSSDQFSVDISDYLLAQINPSGVPSFYLGLEDMGNAGYSNVSSLITSELISTNNISMALSYSTEAGVMNVKVQSQLENQFTGDNCYLAIYIMEDGQVATQNVMGVDDPNYVHNNILRTEANGLAFGTPITFTDGKNLTEVNANLAPATIWTHENLYALAVIWHNNGGSYEFVNLAK